MNNGKWTLTYIVRELATGEETRNSVLQMRDLDDCQSRLLLAQRRLGNLHFSILEPTAISPDGDRYGLELHC